MGGLDRNSLEISKRDLAKLRSTIKDSEILYIKLGEKGNMFEHCLRHNRVYFGFGTEGSELNALVMQARHSNDADKWKAVEEYYKKPSLKYGRNPVNSVRRFFEGDRNTIWITFHDRQMYWCKLKPDAYPIEHTPDPEDGELKPMQFAETAFGWCNKSLMGHHLDMGGLSGILTKTSGTQNTIAGIYGAAADYAKCKIRGKAYPPVGEATAARDSLISNLETLIKLLTPEDFETLAELIFAHSGWLRIGATGATQKTIDIDLQMPLNGERAFVQVKSSSNLKKFNDEYLSVFLRNREYSKLFWVEHSENAEKVSEHLAKLRVHPTVEENADQAAQDSWRSHFKDQSTYPGPLTDEMREKIKGIQVCDSEWLAKRALDAGLAQWLIDRVS
ncbi:MAG: hypothetical protein ACPG1C_08635 [Alphaproteobacteria bacterium]